MDKEWSLGDKEFQKWFDAIDDDKKDGALVVDLLMAVSTPSDEQIQPTDTAFTVLFEALFVLTSPMALLGNMGSIISIGDRWRYDTTISHTVSDTVWVLALNAIALALGCLANLILLLHMNFRVSRRITLSATLASFTLAIFIYLSLLGACEYQYFGKDTPQYHRTYGYYHAVCATSLYALAILAILFHMFYFRNRPFNPLVSRNQQKLMLLCYLYTTLIIVGGASFSAKSMLNLSFADSIYYIVVSYLTLGYGDVVAHNNLGRALTIPFLYSGIIIGALVSVYIFQATFHSVNSRSLNSGVERNRLQAVNDWRERDLSSKENVSDKDSFDLMRKIIDHRTTVFIVARFVASFAWLVVLWLFGALIFSYTEGWSYFTAFYMCSISLASVGYGDFVPTSAGGRSVFIYWVLVALPTMSAAVSGLASLIQVIVRKKPQLLWLTNKIIRVSDPKIKSIHRRRLHAMAHYYAPSGETWHYFLKVAEAKDDTKFDYETFAYCIRALYETDELDPMFWISRFSPIRRPLINEKRLLTLLIMHVLRLEERSSLKARFASDQEPIANPKNADSESTRTTSSSGKHSHSSSTSHSEDTREGSVRDVRNPASPSSSLPHIAPSSSPRTANSEAAQTEQPNNHKAEGA